MDSTSIAVALQSTLRYAELVKRCPAVIFFHDLFRLVSPVPSQLDIMAFGMGIMWGLTITKLLWGGQGAKELNLCWDIKKGRRLCTTTDAEPMSCCADWLNCGHSLKLWTMATSPPLSNTQLRVPTWNYEKHNAHSEDILFIQIWNLYLFCHNGNNQHYLRPLFPQIAFPDMSFGNNHSWYW